MALSLICIQAIDTKAKEETLKLKSDIQVQCLMKTRHHRHKAVSSKEYVGETAQII